MDEIQDYKYKFSIVMAIYNVEPFIEEAIDSVINQTIGFRENVQLILVDDGSPDNSGAICDAYKEKYPDNIVVIHKENGGLPSAREAGVKEVQGKYIGFMDPDDMYTLNTLELVNEFFDLNYDNIDLVTIPIRYFGSQEGEHPNNKRFRKGSRIVDLFASPDEVQMSIATSFVKNHNSVSLEFDSRLTVAEDARTVCRILAEKLAYGLVDGCFYEYRIHPSSILQASRDKKEAYINVVKYFYQWVVNYFIKHEKWGFIPKYAQYMIMYDLRGQVREADIPKCLTEDEKKEYLDCLYTILWHLDTSIIMQEKSFNIEKKAFLLQKKFGKKMGCKVIAENNFFDYHYSINDVYIAKESSIMTTLHFIKIKNNMLTIEGEMNFFENTFRNDVEVVLLINNKVIKCENLEKVNLKYCNGEILSIGKFFKVSIQLENLPKENELKFAFLSEGKVFLKKYVVYGRYMPIGKEYKNAYYFKDNWIMTISDTNTIRFVNADKRSRRKCEKSYLEELWRTKEISNRKAFFARILHDIAKRLWNKEIWLISDKAMRGDDNGEAFFRYINSIKDKDVVSYFVINKESPDAARIKQIGKIVDHLSWRHKFLFLLADKLISAHSHMEITNPFGDFFTPYRDIMCEKSYVFLQHGVTYNDISNGLNKYTRNIQLFITAANAEYEDILTSKYGYSNENVVLTGFPRHDLLYNENRNIVTIAPTWRRYLFNGFDQKKDQWILLPGLQNTDYYQFYINLLNNDRLHKAAEQYGYEIHFLPHSIFFPYIEKFKTDSRVKVHGTEIKYRDMFAKSSLFITDYSSVAFDFAYLRKPVIYTQFDKELFYQVHGYKQGYFDFERDGFGEVVLTLEDTVECIIEYMKNGCSLKRVYKERIDNFFCYNDKQNCERVYKAIKNIE